MQYVQALKKMFLAMHNSTIVCVKTRDIILCIPFSHLAETIILCPCILVNKFVCKIMFKSLEINRELLLIQAYEQRIIVVFWYVCVSVCLFECVLLLDLYNCKVKLHSEHIRRILVN